MLRRGTRIDVFVIFILAFLCCPSATITAGQFRSAWPKSIERIWIGPEYWSNRLQDWRIRQGRLECVISGHDRNVHLLTRQLGKQKGDLRISVRLGRLQNNEESKSVNGWAGFRIGAKGRFNDYRDSAVRGRGMNVGVTTAGELFIGWPETNKAQGTDALALDDIELHLAAEPTGESYKLTLTANDPKTGELLGSISRDDISANDLVGNLALVCNYVQLWFRDWKISGSKVESNDDQIFGPVLFSQYTLSKGVLKMTAQMPPIGQKDSQSVRLEVRKKGSDNWNTIGEAKIDKLARTATFRIEKWDASYETPYRLAYALIGPDDKPKDYYFRGTIRREPVNKETIVVAAFTGNGDMGFPGNDIVRYVKLQKPDVLVFTGDQIYESIGGYGYQRSPLETACLSYLRKWYLFGWVYRDLMRDRPSICLPDDHDVYQANLWGAGGRAAKTMDDGGYVMPPEWVNMVERTQTSHLPDPYDPRPVEQGIGVYYTSINYGGVSFAIIEDRKFKSSPTVMLPKAKVINGWAQNPSFDATKEADVPRAVLLGDRQLKFLRNWSADWGDGVWMKVVLSQTIFSNLATLPRKALNSRIMPRLKITRPGEYPKDDVRAADMDSDGWPQTGRNKALRQMRRGFAFHIAGDQHLGSTTQYGIDDWNDAGFALCVPSIANMWPRRWFPPMPGGNRKPGSPKYTGDYLDGFGNHMTVYAVANPIISGYKPINLYARAPGYGIVKFNRNQRTITIECWPRWQDPSKPDAKQYIGWPITIKQTDNYARKAAAWLPTIKVSGITDPVIQVIDEQNREIVYTLRIKGTSFRPKVFKDGTYTVKVGEPDTAKMKILQGVRSIALDENQTVEVKIPGK